MSAVQKPVTKMVEYPEREMSIRALTIQPEQMQTRAGTDPRVVNVYSRAKASGSVFPPVVVFHTPEDEHLLADGFTRVAAWQSLRLASIRAVIREGTREEAILYGIKHNFDPDNIREVTEADRFHAAKIMIRNESFREWSNKEIANRCGINSGTVNRLRLALRDQESIPLPGRVMTFRDGKPTGKKTAYRQKRFGSSPHLNSKGKLRILQNGKDTQLSGQAADEWLNDRIKAESSLKTTAAFRSYLGSRSILAVGRPFGTVGGFVIGDVTVFPVHELSYEVILATIAKAILVSVEECRPVRSVLVGYFGGLKAIHGHVVSLARQLTPPIEFMTPEELAAEFGPKGDAAVEPEPEQPDPAAN